MRYREMTLAFVVVAAMATVMAFSGTDPIDNERPVTAAAFDCAGSPTPTGYLGLVAQSVGDGSTLGTLVEDVLNGGPAGKAGIRRGDVIIAFDGRPVRNGADLPRSSSRSTVAAATSSSRSSSVSVPRGSPSRAAPRRP